MPQGFKLKLRKLTAVSLSGRRQWRRLLDEIRSLVSKEERRFLSNPMNFGTLGDVPLVVTKRGRGIRMVEFTILALKTPFQVGAGSISSVLVHLCFALIGAEVAEFAGEIYHRLSREDVRLEFGQDGAAFTSVLAAKKRNHEVLASSCAKCNAGENLAIHRRPP